MNREQAIKYFNQRLKELQAYMACIKDGKEREEVLCKYKRFYQILQDLKGEEEW